jgi:hypothetical protein
MPYDELGNYIQGDDAPSVDQMKYALAQRGSMPLRNGSDVPYVASEVPSIRVPVQPKEPPRPASSATNIVQALADKFGITAIPQSVLAIARGFPAEIAKGMGQPELSQRIAYQPTSTMAQDILAGLEEAPRAITGSHMGFGALPEIWIPKGRGVSPDDVRVMGANAKRVAGEVRDIPTDFANAQSGIRRENAFGEPTLGVKAQGAVESVAPVVYPKIEQFMENIGGLKRIDVGPSAKNWSKASEDVFKREFTTARKAGQSVDEANITAWRASQLNDVPEGAPGSLGTRYLPMTDKVVQETMLGEPEFEPTATPRKSAPKEMMKIADDLAKEHFGVTFSNLTPEQKTQLRDYALALRTVGKSANLPAALEAYPELAGYRYEYTPTRKNISGGFGRNSKTITIESPKREAGASTIHELTHAIQDIEDLPQGANTAMFDLTTAEGRKYQKYANELQDEDEALMHASFMLKKAEENNIPIADYIVENNKQIDSLFQKEPKGISSREANILNRMDELAMKHTPQELEQMKLDLEKKIAKNPRNPYRAYSQVFGEAHARNVERRRKLPFDKRREIFPESTLDVPRDQLRYSVEEANAPDLQLKAEEKPKRQSKAEAIEQGLYHPVGGGLKLKRPVSEMDIQTMDNPDMPLVPKKEMKPEDMVGGAIIPLSMDLSSAGKIITGVGGKELIVPVKTQGGYQFMQWNGDAWSSLPNVSKRIGSQIQTAREMEGVDPDKIFGVTKTMSPTAVDFNHMTTEVVLNQFDPTTIPKPVAKDFNKAVREQAVKNQNTGAVTYPFRSFAGIETPEGRAQLLEISNWGGELRKNMLHKMSLKDFKEAGFPDVAEARAAISAPELLDQPIGMTGHGIARFDPSGELNLDPLDPHYTYTANIKGHPTLGGYAGAFKTPVSNEVTFKNYFDTRRALSKPKSSDDRAFSMSMPIQKTNQEWLDTVMAEMEAQDKAIKEGLTMDEARLAIMRKEEEPKQLSPKDDLGFYSNVEKAALNLKRQSGNGQAYMNDIKKQAGVHADELEAIGLPEFLASKKTFTTPEVQEFIANNRLNLTETKFSTDGNDYYNSLTEKILYDMGYDIDHAPRSILNEASEKARQIMGEGRAGEVLESPDALSENKVLYGPDTYPEYMTPGGQNYRELILQIPERKVKQIEPIDTSGWTVETLGSDPYTGQRSIKLFNENGSPLGQRSGFRGNDDEAIRDHVNKLQKLEQEDAKAQSNFTGSHYGDYPNTVLNMRLQDFRDAEGKRGTLIDELQSDWHQKGRSQGYQVAQKVDPNLVDEMMDKIHEAIREKYVKRAEEQGLERRVGEEYATAVIRSQTQEEKATQAGMLDEWRDLRERINAGARGRGVPDAPYKERWHELGIKKAVIDSIKRGDDRIYLPEGKDVSDRYDLSKQVKELTYANKKNGNFLINATDKNGRPALVKEVTEKELPDLVGKDLANKIIADSKVNLFGNTFSGLDLKVGGEGMTKYYDEVYPAVLKKLAKQYGGKFGETEIQIAPKKYMIVDKEGKLLNSAEFTDQLQGNVELWKLKQEEIVPDEAQLKDFGGATRKVRYYEPDEEAKVKIQGGIAMKDGGAVHMNEGGKPLTPYEQFKIENEEKIRQGKEEIANRNKYDPYKGSGKPVPTTRPSGAAGVAPSIEPSGSGGNSLINPLNRKNGGDVNLDAMRYALTKGK